MRKLTRFLLIGVFMISGSIFAKVTSELVKSGNWTATVDTLGSKVSPVSKTPSSVSAEFTISPEDSAKQKWTWGSLKGMFGKNGETVSVESYSKVSVAYISDAPYEISYLQKEPKITKDGAYHLLALESTNGKEVTKVLELKNFKQPSWSGLNQPLNQKSCQGINFQPKLPQGGKTKITIKKIDFIK